VRRIAATLEAVGLSVKDAEAKAEAIAAHLSLSDLWVKNAKLEEWAIAALQPAIFGEFRPGTVWSDRNDEGFLIAGEKENYKRPTGTSAASSSLATKPLPASEGTRQGLGHAAFPSLEAPPLVARPRRAGTLYRTGFAGRPSGRWLIETEMKRRAENGDLKSTLSAEAKELISWNVETHPYGPPMKEGALKNSLRDQYRKLKAKVDA
jgi:hypothetical protein